MAVFLLLSGSSCDFRSLNYAVVSKKSSIVELVEDQICLDDVNEVIDGETPLSFAAKIDAIPLAKYLVAKGASIHAVNATGKSPIFVAVEWGHSKFVEYLLSEGAWNESDHPALFTIASKKGHLATCETLLRHQAKRSCGEGKAQVQSFSTFNTAPIESSRNRPIHEIPPGEGKDTRSLQDQHGNRNSRYHRQENGFPSVPFKSSFCRDCRPHNFCALTQIREPTKFPLRCQSCGTTRSRKAHFCTKCTTSVCNICCDDYNKHHAESRFRW